MIYGMAIREARSGKTISRGGKIVRFLTQDEANAVYLERDPHRTIVLVTEEEHDPKTGNIVGQPKIEDGKIVVEEYGAGRPQALGLFDASDTKDLREWRPSEDEIAAEDWEVVG